MNKMNKTMSAGSKGDDYPRQAVAGFMFGAIAAAIAFVITYVIAGFFLNFFGDYMARHHGVRA